MDCLWTGLRVGGREGGKWKESIADYGCADHADYTHKDYLMYCGTDIKDICQNFIGYRILNPEFSLLTFTEKKICLCRTR